MDYLNTYYPARYILILITVEQPEILSGGPLNSNEVLTKRKLALSVIDKMTPSAPVFTGDCHYHGIPARM